MSTDVEPVVTPGDTDEGMTSHLVCPHCNPNWEGELGFPAMCGVKLLGIPADGKRRCKECMKLWYPHIRDVHMFGGRG